MDIVWIVNEYINENYFNKLKEYSEKINDKSINDKDEKKLICGVKLYDELKRIESIIDLLKYKNGSKIKIRRIEKRYLQRFCYEIYDLMLLNVLCKKELYKYAKRLGGKIGKSMEEKCKRRTKRDLYSKNERLIMNNLKKMKYKNYLVIREKYLDVRYKKNLYADFYIYVYPEDKNRGICVEYDGVQHYDKNNFLYSEDTLKRDDIKNNFCLDNYISLIRCDTIEYFNNNIDEIIEKTKKGYQLYMIERDKIKICRKIPDGNDIPDDFHKKIVWTD